MTRILHIVEALKGGPATYLSEIGPPMLKRNGNDVIFFVPHGQAHELSGIAPDRIKTFPYKRRTPVGLFLFFLDVFRIIHVEKPQLIHSHSSFAGFAVRIALSFNFLHRPKHIYSPHGWAFSMEQPYFYKYLFGMVEKLFSPLANAIVVTSRDEFESAISVGISSDRMRIIYNAVGEPKYTSPPAWAGDVINVLFVGRFDRQKGLDIVLAAMKILEGRGGIHLYVIGEGVKDRAEPEPQPDVTFLGWVPRACLDDYFKAADVVVMPSRWEAFGLVAAEAMRNETAVLASRRGALPEIVEDGVTGALFDPTQLTKLAYLLGSLDRAELKIMGERGRARQLALFSVGALDRSLSELYDEVLVRG